MRLILDNKTIYVNSLLSIYHKIQKEQAQVIAVEDNILTEILDLMGYINAQKTINNLRVYVKRNFFEFNKKAYIIALKCLHFFNLLKIITLTNDNYLYICQKAIISYNNGRLDSMWTDPCEKKQIRRWHKQLQKVADNVIIKND